jgi:hyperosmotically inducible periplasmic protein
MKKKPLVPLLAGALSIVFAASCAGPAAGGDGRKDADTPAGKADATPVQAADAAPNQTPTPVVASGTSSPAGTARAGAASPTPAPNRSGASGTAAAKIPEPVVGSGGNDLFLFTRVRAAFEGATELRGSGVVLNISNGVVLLTGTVADEAQKARAAEVARGVEGVTGVKNELRVAKGGAAR